MHVHDSPAGRRHFDLQIRQTLIVTQTGLWLVMLVIFIAITPLFGKGVWPLIERVEFSNPRRVVNAEEDVYVTVVASGAIFVDERRATFEELVAALRKRDAAFLVRVDRRAPFGAVRVVIRAAQEANGPRLTLLGEAAQREGLSLDHVWY